MRVTALADDILRVRAAAAEVLPEHACWAVPEEVRGRSIPVSVKPNIDGVEFQTAALRVRIERSPLRLIVSDLAGHVISADDPTRAVDVVGAFPQMRSGWTSTIRTAIDRSPPIRLLFPIYRR